MSGSVTCHANDGKREPARPVVYIAASAGDARFTRICVASVRRYYPDVSLKILPGGPISKKLVSELRAFWNVEVVDVPAGDYGWGFVKLEPLFGASGERFLVLDSDTVMTGPVLDQFEHISAPFVVDDEQQSPEDTERLYYDWQALRSLDPFARPPRFVFNSGQWLGTAGRLTREDFLPWLVWEMPRRLRHPHLFMPGDQGVLNYVLNRKSEVDGLAVHRLKLMRWPGHGMAGLDARAIEAGVSEPVIIHWAGLKRALHRSIPGADVLDFFEREYFQRMPSGRQRRVFAVAADLAFRALNRVRRRFSGMS